MTKPGGQERKGRVHDSPDRLSGSDPGRTVKAADEKALKQERQEKKAKKAQKAKAQKLPALTHNFTHKKILSAQKRLLKGLKKREERARARVKELGLSKNKQKHGAVGGF
ncbi:hypothetical protein INS49_003860 [Diaporthe citri]|uniref:uncharacterized protein n=1 Tax=Diaporthe citri TaxID=83186 RepID=UPI001C8273FB|nr:uncharacterized protein INS49_003860 [Diaporthe citri]KAG6354779.1 hypothetical protein INS49_003860 [Diaporthe citri]